MAGEAGIFSVQVSQLRRQRGTWPRGVASRKGRGKNVVSGVDASRPNPQTQSWPQTTPETCASCISELHKRCDGHTVVGLRSAQVPTTRESAHDSRCAGDAQAHDDNNEHQMKLINHATRDGCRRVAFAMAETRRVGGVRREVVR